MNAEISPTIIVRRFVLVSPPGFLAFEVYGSIKTLISINLITLSSHMIESSSKIITRLLTSKLLSCPNIIQVQDLEGSSISCGCLNIYNICTCVCPNLKIYS